MEYYYRLLNEALRVLGTETKIRPEIRFDRLDSFATGKIDLNTLTIVLDHTLRYKIKKLPQIIRHEAMHLDQYAEDPERYIRMSQIPGSYAFRILFHDTLINCLEVEARIFGKHNIVTKLPRQYLWEFDSTLGFVPFEWLIQNPAQAAKLLQLHSNWGRLQDHTNLPEFVWQMVDNLKVLPSELVPEAIALSKRLEELLQKLQEIVPDIAELSS